MTPRSIAIAKTWSNLDIPSLFSAIIYPSLGILALVGALLAGALSPSLNLAWWMLPAGLFTVGLTVFICNQGIGPLHRVWQHKAGELHWPAAVIVVTNCLIAMQGQVRDWVNYHSQHHRFSDQPGDPHNPKEGFFWAWMGWILFRDPTDAKRPMPLWLRDNAVVRFADQRLLSLSLLIHLAVPLAIYAVVWALGGSLLGALILHACAVIGRAIQFHATVLGINVFGHMNVPHWFTIVLAFLTGGEAFHAHHHDEPVSALHRPKRGVWNRIVDYNGTVLLVFQKLGMAKNLVIAPAFR